jgi:hypothetical protein
VSRFNHVRYDEKAVQSQTAFKEKCEQLEKDINRIGSSLDPLVDKAFCARSKEFAIAKLEEVYMWIGKAIRDEQIARNLSGQPEEKK